MVTDGRDRIGRVFDEVVIVARGEYLCWRISREVYFFEP